MLKEVIMFSSTGIFWYLGALVFLKAKRKEKRELYKFSLFYILMGIAILFYYLRDIFVESSFLDILFYRIGAIFHIGAFFFIFLFSVDIFYSKRVKRKLYIFGGFISLIAGMLILIAKIEREVREVVLDVPYKISYVTFPNVTELYLLTIFALTGFFLPIISFAGYGLKNKERRFKSFVYASSLVVIVLGSVLCYLVSPILARTLYLVGAFICFYAFKLKR